MSKLGAVVRGEGEGEKLWFYGGGVHTWLATSAELTAAAPPARSFAPSCSAEEQADTQTVAITITNFLFI